MTFLTDPRRSDQIVRGVVLLPHGTGKVARVAVFASGAAAEKARALGEEGEAEGGRGRAAAPGLLWWGPGVTRGDARGADGAGWGGTGGRRSVKTGGRVTCAARRRVRGRSAGAGVVPRGRQAHCVCVGPHPACCG